MTPGFALVLAYEGIRLLWRSPDGWLEVGYVALESPDLRGELARLKSEAAALAPDGIETKLVIPNDQIRYLALPEQSDDHATTRERIERALEASTPLAIEEIVYDWRHFDDAIQVAAVARQTLREALEFAAEHGFGPVGFVAVPPDGAFAGEPSFHCPDLLDRRMTPDDRPVRIAGRLADWRAEQDAAEAERGDEAAPGDGAKATAFFFRHRAPTRPTAEADGTGPADRPSPGRLFASRRRRAGNDGSPPAVAAEEALRARPRLSLAPLAADERPIAAPAGDSRASASPAAMTAALRASDVAGPAGDARGLRAPTRGGRGQGMPELARRSLEPTEDERRRMIVFGAREREAGTTGPRPGVLLAVAIALGVFGVGALAYWQLGPSAPVSDPATSTGPEIAASAPAPAPPTATEAAALPPPETSTIRPRPRPPGAVRSARPPDPETPAMPAERALAGLGLAEVGTVAPVSENRPLPRASAGLPDDGSEGEERLDLSDALELPPPAAPVEVASAAQPAAPGPAPAPEGIHPTAPVPPPPTHPDGIDDLYTASIDPTISPLDAVALPPVTKVVPDGAPRAQVDPPPAGMTFELDERGLVRATPEGAVTPEGVIVFSGRPSVTPPPRSGSDEEDAGTAGTGPIARLAPGPVGADQAIRPRTRPADLVEQAERARLGGRSVAELQGARPRVRPASILELARERAERDAAVSAALNEALADGAEAPAVTSLVPQPRPESLTEAFRTARREEPAEAQPSPAPRLPSNASVTRAATIEDAINLRRLSLIGIFGSSTTPRALVRLPNGKVQKVTVGDRLDGGKVTAIGDGRLIYLKRGRSITLAMPKG